MKVVNGRPGISYSSGIVGTGGYWGTGIRGVLHFREFYYTQTYVNTFGTKPSVYKARFYCILFPSIARNKASILRNADCKTRGRHITCQILSCYHVTHYNTKPVN